MASAYSERLLTVPSTNTSHEEASLASASRDDRLGGVLVTPADRKPVESRPVSHQAMSSPAKCQRLPCTASRAPAARFPSTNQALAECGSKMRRRREEIGRTWLASSTASAGESKHRLSQAPRQLQRGLWGLALSSPCMQTALYGTAGRVSNIGLPRCRAGKSQQRPFTVSIRHGQWLSSRVA